MLSTQDIQNLFSILNDLRQRMSEFIGKANADHSHLSKAFEDHVEQWEAWKEKMESQVNSIANALLVNQTLDDVEREQDDKGSDRKLLWQTTIVIVVVTVLTNLKEIFNFFERMFGFLAG